MTKSIKEADGYIGRYPTCTICNRKLNDNDIYLVVLISRAPTKEQWKTIEKMCIRCAYYYFAENYIKIVKKKLEVSREQRREKRALSSMKLDNKAVQEAAGSLHIKDEIDKP